MFDQKKPKRHSDDRKLLDDGVAWLRSKNLLTPNPDPNKIGFPFKVTQTMLRHIEKLARKNQKWPTRHQVAKAALLTIDDFSDLRSSMTPYTEKAVAAILYAEMELTLRKLKKEHTSMFEQP